MNRLEYSSSNLAIAIENASAANSVVRDVDMAAEMTTFTKTQILIQAGTAMLAQANSSPQLVLSLFGGR
jgi:flagellin